MKANRVEVVVIRWAKGFYQLECSLFLSVNKFFDYRLMKSFFSLITYAGGATFTISVTLCIILFTDVPLRDYGFASLLALLISHIPVQLLKKIYPRRRPYIVLSETKVTNSPLEDHSFQSGHTTAIFAVITPFVMYSFMDFLLYTVACSVAVSRVILGLHYPSDIVAGACIGSLVGYLSVLLLAI